MTGRLRAAIFCGERIDAEYWPPGTTRKALSLTRDLMAYLHRDGVVPDGVLRRIEAIPDLALALLILQESEDWEWAERACRSVNDSLRTLDHWMAAAAALRVAITEAAACDAGEEEDQSGEL